MRRTLVLIALVALLVGCGGAEPTPDSVATQIAVEKAAHATMTAEVEGSLEETPATSEVEQATATIQSPTDTAIPPTDTVVPPTDTAIPPTDTPEPPTNTPEPAAERISFSPGATAAIVEGDLAAQGKDRYVLRVMAGQLMEVHVDPQDKVQLAVYGADGTVLKSGMGGDAFFRGTVPSTQDYILGLSAGTEAVAYTLHVIIPVRISFAAGTTSATVEGDLAPAQTLHYVLNIAAGQQLEINSSPLDMRLAIYGADGTVLKSGMGGDANFQGTVPSTQDYILGVGPATAPGPFTMQVIIPAPVRISFAAGTTSAIVEGDLAPAQTLHYVLNIAAGQLLEIRSSLLDMRLAIYGADGTVLKSGMGGDAFFRGTVPSTQDYILDVGPATAPGPFTMEVRIPARISFAAGATSATVDGNLAAGQLYQFYVLRASGGQTMEVHTTPELVGFFSIYGADGTVLLKMSFSGPSWSGTLPSDQDYILGLAGGPEAVAYTLEVSIE